MFVKSPMFRAGMAEALGVFILTLIAAAAVCMDSLGGEVGKGAIGQLGIAFASGLALMVAVYMTMGISGAHLNPAVSAAMLVAGKIRAGQAIFYMVMQLLGGVAAGLALWGMFSRYRSVTPYLGTPGYDDLGGSLMSLEMPKAIGIEMLLTFVLAITVLMVAVDASRAAKQMFGLCIGLVVTACMLAAGPYTGAAMNPARYFGPAAVSGHVTQLGAYFIGPLLGGIAAAIFYRLFLQSKEEPATD